jgi:hypothetical protein
MKVEKSGTSVNSLSTMDHTSNDDVSNDDICVHRCYIFLITIVLRPLLQPDGCASARMCGVHGGELQTQPAGAPGLLPHCEHSAQCQSRLSGMMVLLMPVEGLYRKRPI